MCCCSALDTRANPVRPAVSLASQVAHAPASCRRSRAPASTPAASPSPALQRASLRACGTSSAAIIARTWPSGAGWAALARRWLVLTSLAGCIRLPRRIHVSIPKPCPAGSYCGAAVDFDVANENLVLYQLATVTGSAPPAPAGAWSVVGCRTAVSTPQMLGYVFSVAECINLAVTANLAYMGISVVGNGDMTLARSCRGAFQAMCCIRLHAERHGAHRLHIRRRRLERMHSGRPTHRGGHQL